MYRLQSKINTNSEEFKKNKEDFLTLLNKYREIYKVVTRGGSENTIKKHKERGKLLARERIDKLIDPNTPFLELSPLAAYDHTTMNFLLPA